MKNQYVADVNDYRKYGLLRVLSGGGAIRTGVCWMLTPDDGQNHGQSVGYLQQPEKHRAYDPPLFDMLATCVASGERDVRTVEASGILPNTLFHSSVLLDEAKAQAHYFEAMRARFGATPGRFDGVDLVFFDPDIGLEVPSKPHGRRHSSMYLYWDELEATYGTGASVLVYQHFGRQPREPFIERLAQTMVERLEAPAVLAFRTPHVLFLLAAQGRHVEHFERQSGVLAERWGERQLRLGGVWSVAP